jgi:hypothetical protein
MSKSFKKKKKAPVLSREEREGIAKRLAEYAARKKTLKGYAFLKKKESKQDVKISGSFKDRAELDKFVEDYVVAMNKSAGADLWKVISVHEVVPEPVVSKDEGNETENEQVCSND